MAGQPQSFEEAKARLNDIADAVGDADLSLDDALDLFEEAVALGLRVSDLIEEGIVIDAENAHDHASAETERDPHDASAQTGVAQRKEPENAATDSADR